ncbi:MAG: DUF494 domain-containing protein [Rhodoferax sp.]|nr:DUF494 domain-containing protein [Rhodoferax sp.]
MFEVLAFVYENYDAGDSWPEPAHLERKLNAVGFEADEIDDALTWLTGLHAAARGSIGFAGTTQHKPPQPWLCEPQTSSVRIYPVFERNHLGRRCLGFIHFLESSGALSASMREVVIERALAAPGAPVSLNALKLIVLMVYWSFGQQPEPLVLDELCYDGSGRVAH